MSSKFRILLSELICWWFNLFIFNILFDSLLFDFLWLLKWLRLQRLTHWIVILSWNNLLVHFVIELASTCLLRRLMYKFLKLSAFLLLLFNDITLFWTSWRLHLLNQFQLSNLFPVQIIAVLIIYGIFHIIFSQVVSILLLVWHSFLKIRSIFVNNEALILFFKFIWIESLSSLRLPGCPFLPKGWSNHLYRRLLYKYLLLIILILANHLTHYFRRIIFIAARDSSRCILCLVTQ